jgi:RNA polymerase-binding transcription factor DksA
MTEKVRLCQRCKAVIPAERVEAIPETRLCIACSQAVGGEFEMQVFSENLAKTTSLKKNYGSWEVKKRRRKLP